MAEKSTKKIRLDQRLVELGLAENIDVARRLILAGLVYTGTRIIDKPGMLVSSELPIYLKKTECPYVSVGGFKLAEALDRFKLNPQNKYCLDIGASTGGFTDVLIQRGAAEVTALDVGYGILDWKLRLNPKVKVIERVNFRLIKSNFFDKKFDIITIDVSFISLKLIVPKAKNFLETNGDILALIKPQFEAPPEKVENGGIVSSAEVWLSVLLDLTQYFKSEGLYLHGLAILSKLRQNKNQEFFSWWKTNLPDNSFDQNEIINRTIALVKS